MELLGTNGTSRSRLSTQVRNHRARLAHSFLFLFAVMGLAKRKVPACRVSNNCRHHRPAPISSETVWMEPPPKFRRTWWQIWWQIRGIRGTRGEASHYSIQQLADSIQPFPEFESLSPASSQSSPIHADGSASPKGCRGEACGQLRGTLLWSPLLPLAKGNGISGIA
jgi:hypothetical protein